MPFDFDAIIIGTGFGATVVAIELANRMKTSKILMLERGVWWFTPERLLPAYITGKPGGKREPLQYWPRPDNRFGLLDLLSVVKTNNDVAESLRDIQDRPQPLFRYNSFPQVDILTASGVGGGSLVYSNVSIRPHEEAGSYPVMQGWPVELKPADYKTAEQWMTDNRSAPGQVVTNFPLPPRDKTKPDEDGYADRDALLAANPGLLLGRSRFLKDASEAVDGGWKAKKLEDWAALNLQVNEYDPKQPVDPKRYYCERQGRCFMGCLPGARHTLNKTILNKLLTVPNTPVQMQALSDVDHIEPEPGGGYRVFYDNLNVGDDHPDRKKSVSAPVVVLAAGVLGTVELLLKSQNRFKFSPQLGRKFSTNGDFAGFIANPLGVQSLGMPYNIYATRGPINTSHVMFKDQDAAGKDIFINVEDAGIPPMLAAPVKRALEVFQNAADRDPFIRSLKALWKLALPDPGLGLGLAPDARLPDRSQTEAEMLQNVFFFNVMGRDRGRGKFSLKGDDLTLDFEGDPLARDPVFRKIDDLMTAMARAMNGKYVRFPFWGRNGFVNNEFTEDRKMITVHPLGGCPMGNDASEGAVDTLGRLFNTDPAAAEKFYPGLYVADASVIPGPLCVNPTLTIVSFAQKIAAEIPAVMAAAGGH